MKERKSHNQGSYFLRIIAASFLGPLVIVILGWIATRWHMSHWADQEMQKWESTKQNFEALGDNFTTNSQETEGLPDELVFTKHPLFGSHDGKRSEHLAFFDLNDGRYGNVFDKSSFNSDFKPDPDRDLGKYLDGLEVGSQYEAAEKVLSTLASEYKSSELFSQAIGSRPHFHAGPFFERPDFEYFVSFINAGQFFQLRAQCYFVRSQNNEALRDLNQLLEISELLAGEESLVGCLVSFALLENLCEAMRWEFSTKGLHANQLAQLRNQLASRDLEAEFLTAVRNERNFFMGNLSEHDFGNLYRNGDAGWVMRYFVDEKFSDGLRAFTFRMLVETHTEVLHQRDGDVDISRVRRNPKIGFNDALKKRLEKSTYGRPVEPLFVLVLGNYESALATLFLRASRLESLITAIAAEEFRQANGFYPENLEQLVPLYLEEFPREFFTDERLRYQVREDGMPQIYSIGLDQTDNGGAWNEDINFSDWDWGFFPTK